MSRQAVINGDLTRITDGSASMDRSNILYSATSVEPANVKR